MINKNGIILKDNLYESDVMLMNKIKSISYIPVEDKINSCLAGESITGFVNGKQYFVEFVLSWSGFKDNCSSNFNCFAQGSTYNGTSWDWTGNNPLTNAIGNFKIYLLSSDSGSKRIQATFTANDRTGYYFGIRTDYSNGTGAVGFSDIKVIPAKYACSTTGQSQIHIGEDFISSREFVEY